MFLRILGWNLILIFSLSTYAQAPAERAPVPVEVMIGHSAGYFQHAYQHTWGKSRFLWSHTASLHVAYDAASRPHEIMVQGYMNYKLNAQFSVGAGFFYSPAPGFAFSVKGQYALRKRSVLYVLSTRFEPHESWSAEVFQMIEYTPRFTSEWYGYGRAQMMFNWGGRGHNRSYQYARLGVGKGKTQWGIAWNNDLYGTDFTWRPNGGIFIKHDF